MINNLYKKFVEHYTKTRCQEVGQLLIPANKMIDRIIYHQKKMPDFLGFGIKMVACIFLLFKSILTILFVNKTVDQYIDDSRFSKFIYFRNLIRFHDALFEVANVSEQMAIISHDTIFTSEHNNFDFIIIGSGPGGAVSARKLQEAGYNSCIIESGLICQEGVISPFSYSEMLNQYKHGGITTTLGNANITYVEGGTFGGGSEINSGLYHRTPNDILQYWKNEYDLLESDADDLEKYFSVIEDNLCISHSPDNLIPTASLKLKEGAINMGWDVQEVPRWFKYSDSKSINGYKLTMSKTYLKHFFNAGGHCFELTKAKKIQRKNECWHVTVLTPDGEKHLSASNVILAAGTISTPQILRRSGISPLAGKSFQMHPTIKVVALFNDRVNHENMGVPVHQVKEFAPKFSFGCSISSMPYLRIAMLDHFEHLNIVDEKWENMAIYYVMIVPEGNGKINNLPFFKDPLVQYNLTSRDKENLADGLKKLCELLVSANAVKIFPSISKGPVISNINEIQNLPESIDPNNSSLMSIHLFSSCPIGERQDRCVANSYGKVFGQEGLFISDGSMLPSAPGVNPQGTIMAFAHRNIENIILQQV